MGCNFNSTEQNHLNISTCIVIVYRWPNIFYRIACNKLCTNIGILALLVSHNVNLHYQLLWSSHIVGEVPE